MNDAKPLALPWLPVRSLTRARVDTGVSYTREPLVTRQITHLCGLPARERRTALCALSVPGDTGRIKEETLVYFIREYDRRGEKQTAWDILETLVARLGAHIGRELKKWRLPQSEQDECTESVIAELYERIFSHDAREEFWEVRFWVCLDRRIHAFAEKLQRLRDRELRPADDDAGADDTARGLEGVFATLATTDASPEIMAVRKDLQNRLSASEYHAVFLKYIERMPEESGDADRVTIAKLLGVTGRTVRNYLRRAEKILLAPDTEN